MNSGLATRSSPRRIKPGAFTVRASGDRRLLSPFGTPAPRTRSAEMSDATSILDVLSIASLSLSGFCFLIVALDLLRHPQHMWIMNVVWPVSALFGSVWIVWQYFKYGRLAERRLVHEAKQNGEDPPYRKLTPFTIMVANGTLHCGSGCTLGDIVAKFLIAAFPTLLIAFGYRTLFSDEIFARWIIAYIFAYAFGIVFQYFTIAPMRGLSFWSCGRHQGRYAFAHRLAVRHVRLHGDSALRHFSNRIRNKTQASVARVLVHDANCNALWLRHVLPRQLVADHQRDQGEDVARTQLRPRANKVAGSTAAHRLSVSIVGAAVDKASPRGRFR